MIEPEQEYFIVFFDGYCNLCNGLVDFLIRKDKKRLLKYSSLQGETWNSTHQSFSELSSIDSVVFYDGHECFIEMDAAIKITEVLGFPYTAVKVFGIFPKRFQSALYRLVARNRFKWFGKRDTCRVPTDEERELFLD